MTYLESNYNNLNDCRKYKIKNFNLDGKNILNFST